MKTTVDILQEELRGKRNPNGFTILWDFKTLPCGTTWSTGYDGYEIIPHDWGFELIKSNGRIAPPNQVNFGKFTNESDFSGAFNRAMDFLKINCEVSKPLACGIFGD